MIDADIIEHSTDTVSLFSLEYSNWRCYLFGGDSSSALCWTPLKGGEPNWFWRKMQYLVFGNKWVKPTTTEILK